MAEGNRDRGDAGAAAEAKQVPNNNQNANRTGRDDAVPYLPPHNRLSNVIRESAQEGTVTVPKAVFELMLRLLFRANGFDEKWYLANNGDVAQAVQKGALHDALAHFLASGYRENRLPRIFDVDERWYRAKYADIDAGIKAGKIATGHNHYNSVGYFEGRYPSAAAESLGEAWRTTLES